jgi:hypothetical protein
MKKFALALPIVIAAVFVACGDDDDAETTAPTSPAASSPATSGTPPAGDGETFSSSQLPISVTISPGPGFFVPEDADLSDIFAVAQTGSTGGYIDFVQPTQVYTYTSETESEVGEPPADFVQWFNDLPFPTIADSQEVTVGGRQGTRLEIKNTDNEDFAVFKLSDGSNYDIDYLGSGSLYSYVLGESGNQVLIICATESPNNFGTFKSTCEDALATVEFGD